MFWKGYQDAERWFREPPNGSDMCGCRSGGRRASDPDVLRDERLTKHAAAQKLLLQIQRPHAQSMHVVDPWTGENVEELLSCYRRAVDNTWRVLSIFTCSALAILTAMFAMLNY